MLRPANEKYSVKSNPEHQGRSMVQELPGTVSKLEKIIAAAPDSYLILTPDFSIQIVTDAYLTATFTKREEILGKYLFDLFPENLAAASTLMVTYLRHSLDQVLTTQRPHSLSIPAYYLGSPNEPDGTGVKSFNVLNTPVLNETGAVEYIIHKITNAAEQSLASEPLRVSEENHQVYSEQAIPEPPAHLSGDSLGLKQAQQKPETNKNILQEPEEVGQIIQIKNLLQSVFDTSLIGISILEAVRDASGTIQDFRIKLVNKALEKETTRTNLIGKLYSEKFPDIKKAGLFEAMLKVMETGRPEQLEYCYRHEEFNKWFSCTIVKTHEGLVVSNLDITDRKLAELKIQEQAHFIQRITQIVPDMISVMQLDPRTVEFLNKEVYTLYGFNPEDMAALNKDELAELIYTEDRQVVQEYFEKFYTVSDKEIITADYRAKGFTKDWQWFHVRGKAFQRDEKGKVTHILNIVQNITARKKAEQELLHIKDELAQRATDKYQALFNAIDQGFFLCEVIFDNNGLPLDIYYLEANPAATRMLGQNFTGRRLKEIRPNYEFFWIETFGRVVRSGVAERLEHYSEPDKKWFDFYVFSINTENQYQTAVIFHDITDRKRQENNLAFLAELSDAFSLLSTANEIMQLVSEKMGEYMALTTASFLDRDESKEKELVVSYGWAKPGFTSLAGNFRIKDYLTEEFERTCQAGELLVVNNTQTDPRTDPEAYIALNIGSFVGIPFFRKGKWKYCLTVTNSEPRYWRKDELELFKEIANRIFPRLERARAEEALRESEEQFRFFITTISDTVYKMSSDWSQVFHLKGKDFLTDAHNSTTNWLETYVPKDDQPQVSAAIREATQNKSIFELEHRVIQANDNIGWTLTRAIPVVNEQGEITEWFGSASDITARKKAEHQLKEFNALLEQQVADRTRALRESKEWFEAAINVSPVVLSILKSIRNNQGEITDFYFEWVSKSGEKMVGKDVTGELLKDHFPHLWEIGLFARFVHTAVTGEPTNYEYSYRADGYDLWVHWKAVQLENGLFVSVEDISERKNAEEELKKNIALLQQAEELAGMGSWDYNLSTGEFIWSEGMYRLFGLNKDAAVHLQTYRDAAIEEDQPVAERIIYYLSEQPASFEEIVRIKLNETIQTLKVKGTLIKDAAGKPAKILGLDLNITEVKRLEEENLELRLRQQKNLLLAILEAQEEERKRISESLHNGVGQILYAAQLSLQQINFSKSTFSVPDLESTKEKTETLIKAAIWETRHVSHELVPLLLEQFGLDMAVQDFCDRFSHTGIKLTCHGLSQRLDKYLELAVYRISQELMNNIAKHSGATRARLEIFREGNQLIIEAQDNGKGMTVGVANQKGIGLKIIQDRVKLLGGTMEVESEPKRGTLITITLPLTL